MHLDPKLLGVLALMAAITGGVYLFFKPDTEAAFVANATQTKKLRGGLVGYWTFDRPDINWAQNKALDRSGQSNNGTVVNMSTTTSPVQGKIGQALTFDGDDESINMGDVLNMGTDSFSYGAWIKASPTGPADSGVVIGKKQDGAAGSVGWHLEYDRVSSLVQVRISNGTTQVVSNFSINQATDGNWHHLFVVEDRTANMQYVYLDTVLKDSDSISGVTGNINNTQNFIIASNNTDATAQQFPGQIDEARIYNRALSAEEVKRLYLTGGGR